MPSQRKRIGFLPTEEVHDIIDKLSIANEFSQSKVTGLLVEEALRSRGVLNDSSKNKSINDGNLFNNYFQKEPLAESNKSSSNSDLYTVNKIIFSEDIHILEHFIIFLYVQSLVSNQVLL